MSHLPSPKPLAWADRLYTPFCGQHLPEALPIADPFEALAASFVPSANKSWEQARRWEHADLAGLSDSQLGREMRQAGLLVAYLSERDDRLPWIEQRLQRLQAERVRRAHGSKR
ncbi:MAG TPA: hypothetical protein GX714_04075 [Chloroflexi bacterium]|jgi:hypothetical protein|nr:hypothetical protein [Chloroflexota bacterium]